MSKLEEQWEEAVREIDRREAALAKEQRVWFTSITGALEAIRSPDYSFHQAAFQEFLFALFAAAHHHRLEGTLAQMSPYLSDAARKELEKLGTPTPGGYRAASTPAPVIEGMSFDAIRGDESGVRVTVTFTSNRGSERWVLYRHPRAVTRRPPSRASYIGCPSCDAPLDQMLAGKCGNCGDVPILGEADWGAETIFTSKS